MLIIKDFNQLQLFFEKKEITISLEELLSENLNKRTTITKKFNYSNFLHSDNSLVAIYNSGTIYIYLNEEISFFEDEISENIGSGIIDKKNLIKLSKVMNKKSFKEKIIENNNIFNIKKLNASLASNVLYHGVTLGTYRHFLNLGGIVGYSVVRYHLNENFKIDFNLKVQKKKLNILEENFMEYQGVCFSRDFEVSKNFGQIVLILDKEKLKSRFKIILRNDKYDIDSERHSVFSEREEFIILDKRKNMDELKEKTLRLLAEEKSLNYEKEKSDEILKKFLEIIAEEGEQSDYFYETIFNYFNKISLTEAEKGSKEIIPLDDYLLGFVIKKETVYEEINHFSWFIGRYELIESVEKSDPSFYKEVIKESKAEDFVKELIKNEKFLGWYY